MQRLDGKTAVITGGGTGIGLAIARRFIAEGATVYLFGRRQAALDDAVEQLGPAARAVVGSVTEPADLARLYDAVGSAGGTLDVVVANAAAATLAPLGQITVADYDTVFGTNVKGVLLTVQQALPLLRAGGSIILIGSSAGSLGIPAFSVYSATKAALRSFARSWMQDLRGSGIRVNVLSPGSIRTDTALALMGEEKVTALANQAPLGRIGEPDEIAAAAAFLASDDSSFMTGTELFADGGVAQG